jgi:hypothetical protein
MQRARVPSRRKAFDDLADHSVFDTISPPFTAVIFFLGDNLAWVTMEITSNYHTIRSSRYILSVKAYVGCGCRVPRHCGHLALAFVDGTEADGTHAPLPLLFRIRR